MPRGASGFRLFFRRQQPEGEIAEPAQVNHVVQKVVVEALYVYVPVQVHDAIAQSDQIPERVREGGPQVPRLGQQSKQVALRLRTAEVVDRDDVACDVGATLNGSLECPFYGKLRREVATERRQRKALKPL